MGKVAEFEMDSKEGEAATKEIEMESKCCCWESEEAATATEAPRCLPGELNVID